VPAKRSRTENWRRSLAQLNERQGSLEITLPRYIHGTNDPDEASGRGQDVIWRVRVMALDDGAIVVERPSMLGRTIELADGLELVAIIAIGQNRWMFETRVMERRDVEVSRDRLLTCLALEMPESVERCQRRNFYRVSTVGLTLPIVECRPLLDPASAAPAEAANRVEIERMIDCQIAGRIGADEEHETLLPEVGPGFQATMMNLGGGGIGLVVEREDRPTFDTHHLFWLNIPLRPYLQIPVAVTARARHTHVDSAQQLYVGLSFEFGYNPAHERFVMDQVCRYVAHIQREQLARLSSA
jgi:c-di-GMP-binding flagellar brake protein YcgR